MAKRVPKIDVAKYKIIGPVQWDVPGAAVTARSLLSFERALRSFLEELFDAHPDKRPNDYDETNDDLVFEESKMEEDTPREQVGRYTFLVGYLPIDNVEPTTASHEGDT